MALRLRRGLNIDRQSIVFAEGELIYTTDSQEIYVGDGSTLGGIRVTGAVSGSPAQLSQNLDLNGYNIQGSGNVNATSFTGDGSNLTNLPSPSSLTGDLNLNTNEIVGSGNININGTVNAIAFAGDGSGLTNVSSGIEEGFEYSIDVRGNVISNTSTIIVNHENGNITGTFIGDGSQLTNLPTPDINYTQWILDVVSGDGSTVILNSATSTFTGNFVGDGSGLTNLPVMPGMGVEAGETYEINIQGDVLGFDSSVLVNNLTNTFTGNFVGDGSGLTNLPTPNINFGSYLIDIVSGDGSTLVVDYVTSTHYGTFVGDGSGLTNLPVMPGMGVEAGETYEINIQGDVLGFDSSVLVNNLTNTFTGNFVGDGSGLTNLPTPNIEFDGYRLNIISGDGSTLVVDYVTSTHYGTFVGDGSGLTNLPPPDIGLIDLDGNSYKINILGNDSTIMVNTDTFELYGDLVGDVEGSVYSISSSLIVDSIAGNIYVNDFYYRTPTLEIRSTDYDRGQIRLISSDERSTLRLNKESSSDLSTSDSAYGQIAFERNDTSGYGVTGLVGGGNKYVYLAADENQAFGDSTVLYLYQGRLVLGKSFANVKTGTAELDIVGDAEISGSVSAGGYVKFGSYTTAERDALTAEVGMVLFNTTTTKLQVCTDAVGPTWIDLH